MADSVGFESLFMHSWRVRERVLNVIEATTGGRVIFGSCKIGGVRRDIDADASRACLSNWMWIEPGDPGDHKVFINDSSVKKRLCGVGVLSRQDAYDLGCVGPTTRASGFAQDMRQLGYAAFEDLKVEPITRNDGDSYARCAVRCEELFQSLGLIRQAISKMPEGEIAVKVTGNPNGEYRRPHRAAARRSALSRKGQRHQEPPAFPGADPHLRQSARAVETVPGCDLADVPVSCSPSIPALVARSVDMPYFQMPAWPSNGSDQAAHQRLSFRATARSGRLARAPGFYQGKLCLLHRLRQEVSDGDAGRESRSEEMGD